VLNGIKIQDPAMAGLGSIAKIAVSSANVAVVMSGEDVSCWQLSNAKIYC
jgi:hypothetical protein